VVSVPATALLGCVEDCSFKSCCICAGWCWLSVADWQCWSLLREFISHVAQLALFGAKAGGGVPPIVLQVLSSAVGCKRLMATHLMIPVLVYPLISVRGSIPTVTRAHPSTGGEHHGVFEGLHQGRQPAYVLQVSRWRCRGLPNIIERSHALLVCKNFSPSRFGCSCADSCTADKLYKQGGQDTPAQPLHYDIAVRHVLMVRLSRTSLGSRMVIGQG